MKALFLNLMAIGLLCSCQQTPTSKYLNLNQSAWRIEIADLNQDNEDELVFATYDGDIFVRSLTGNDTSWMYPVGSFVFSLTCADIDQDQSMEVLVASGDGTLYVLDASGSLLWTFSSKLPLYNVATGNLQGDGDLEIVTGGIDRQVYVLDFEGNLVDQIEAERLVHRVAVGNLDEDSEDEIFIVENRVTGHVLDLHNDVLVTKWRENLSVPQDYVNWENPRGSFFAFSLQIDDLDQDGDNEIIMGDTYFNKQAVMAIDHLGKSLWITEKQPPFQMIDSSQTEFYSFAMVEAADFRPETDGLEVISVAGGMIKLFNANGELLESANASVGFTDIFLQGTNLYLGSSPNGDQSIYQIDMGVENWQDQVLGINRTGKIAQIADNIGRIRKQVLNASTNLPNDQEYFIRYGSVKADSISYQNYLAELQWFNEEFPYDHLKRLVAVYDHLKRLVAVKVIEPTPPLDENGEPWSEQRWSVDAINGTMTVEEIIRIAEFIEENKIPTIFYIGHSCMPFITLETAEKILKAAPNYCYGFQTSEDEQIERIDRFFRHYMAPLADMCVENGYKKVITKNKNLWWMSIPSIASVYESLFSGERKKVIVAATEDSNSRCPEMNLLGRGGLWQAGLIQNNDVSIHADLFSFCRYHQWEYPKIGHPYLRLLVAHTSLGATQFSIRIRDKIQEGQDQGLNYLGKESTEIFYHLLGKGIVFSPRPDQVKGYNPIGIVVHQPSLKWFEDAHNGHRPEIWEDDPELHSAVIPHNGVPWGMTNTPDHALQKVLLHKNRQFGYQLPATPYGLIAFVPDHADLNKVEGIDEWIHTDGIYVWRNNSEKLTGEAAAEFLLNAFSESAARLPFRSQGDDVFMQVIQLSNNRYRLVIADPGWLDPEDRKIKLVNQMDGNFQYQDVITGENVSEELTIPAGTFRILDATKIST